MHIQDSGGGMRRGSGYRGRRKWYQRNQRLVIFLVAMIGFGAVMASGMYRRRYNQKPAQVSAAKPAPARPKAKKLKKETLANNPSGEVSP